MSQDEITYKGVVFNEMKGVYSQPDSVNGTVTQQALFPDNSYSVDSGGNPAVIPDLTFEEFKGLRAFLAASFGPLADVSPGANALQLGCYVHEQLRTPATLMTKLPTKTVRIFDAPLHRDCDCL